MTRVRSLAEQAVGNVWLTLAQRIMTLIVAPLFIAAAYSYMGLRDRVTISEAEAVALKGRVAVLETTASGLRTDLLLQAGNTTRLQAQREGDIQVGRRIDDLREDVQRVNQRLDQMMTPPRRMTP